MLAGIEPHLYRHADITTFECKCGFAFTQTMELQCAEPTDTDMQALAERLTDPDPRS
jgi:hypothetical protein